MIGLACVDAAVFRWHRPRVPIDVFHTRRHDASEFRPVALAPARAAWHAGFLDLSTDTGCLARASCAPRACVVSCLRARPLPHGGDVFRVIDLANSKNTFGSYISTLLPTNHMSLYQATFAIATLDGVDRVAAAGLLPVPRVLLVGGSSSASKNSSTMVASSHGGKDDHELTRAELIERVQSMRGRG
jgi:hypothetical protein